MLLRIVRRLLVFGALAVAFGALVSIAVGDSAINSDNLAASLRQALRAQGGPATCREFDGERWVCEVSEVNGSEVAVYEVTATSDHCWDAQLTEQRGEGAWPEAGGCVG